MIPQFRYHPDPIATGSVIQSENLCRCCDQARGFIYTGPVYAEETLSDDICPFCIVDGSAAERFDALFSDDCPLLEANIPEDIVDEVTKRTPGYTSVQQEAWLACCDDACEFHGDTPVEKLRGIDGEELERLLFEIEWSVPVWRDLISTYISGGDRAVYKFVCRHCGRSRYGIDIA